MDYFKEGCFYCEHNQTQRERMIEIMKLPVSTVYLNRDQTHFGRAIVALNWHVDELFELSSSDLQEFMKEVADVAEEIKFLTCCMKINYAIYGDTVSHLHFHLVPKSSTDNDWNDAFINSPQNVQLIRNEGKYRQFICKMKERLEEKYEAFND
ncbi:HIT family protein [Enterococcus faecalis]|uniref:HIT family protein n=1 Tax=Enterococcus faecalis TaxID=1351 RepID=UPI000CF6F7C1|nr:HIT family protein [Enterococcus faecalis]PQC13587.1 HIT family protein [Enterococcus faecalis]HBI1553334.1 HIT family protein [Enterococcus faecalis]HBI1555829.1 HIT family protein [Enterococcus faecalis]HBI1558892.1 HIT family protein [Enterococcus faecalis]HBI1567785.1 HIT family protein [Enterococcus faecalis]